jgi:histidine ammonia-lyase/tyrosine ammonia-lyase
MTTLPRIARADLPTTPAQSTAPETADAAIASVLPAAFARREPMIEAKPAHGSDTLALGPDVRLTCEDIESAANNAPRLTLTPEARLRVEASQRALFEAATRGDPVYGLTTGFGPFVKFNACSDAHIQGAGLIAHLGAGFGAPAPMPIARATMLVRAQSLAQGCSGVSVETLERLLELLRCGIAPAIPEIGSVGASGDLIPLSFVARVLAGEGRCLNDEGTGTIDAREALNRAGIEPSPLSARDALGIVNGTSFMTGYAAVALARAQRLVERAEEITGWLYRLLGGRAQALDARLHRARGHEGQVNSAEHIRREAERFGAFEDTSRPLQEVYSIRCAPQILGACRDQLDHARWLIETEINGVSDNPVTIASDTAVLHGGNFQGQQIAFACDAINAALVQAAVLAERQLDVLANPDLNGGAPLLLAWEPGATSGLAGAQITATALVAEMRHHGLPSATASIPTNGRNQDVVSMGTLAARAAFGQTDRLAAVLGILSLGAAQLNGLRALGRAPGRTTPAPEWLGGFVTLENDRPLFDEIARLTRTHLETPKAA